MLSAGLQISFNNNKSFQLGANLSNAKFLWADLSRANFFRGRFGKGPIRPAPLLVVGHFWPLPPLCVAVEILPSWLPSSSCSFSASCLSLFSLLPPPLYVSSCIKQLKLCRCVSVGSSIFVTFLLPFSGPTL